MLNEAKPNIPDALVEFTSSIASLCGSQGPNEFRIDANITMNQLFRWVKEREFVEDVPSVGDGRREPGEVLLLVDSLGEESGNTKENTRVGSKVMKCDS